MGTPQESPRDTRRIYGRLVNALIAEGVITRPEAEAIARTGHRKQSYYDRHIIDLLDFVKDRILGKIP
jgi:hypothetical protein